MSTEITTYHEGLLRRVREVSHVQVDETLEEPGRTAYADLEVAGLLVRSERTRRTPRFGAVKVAILKVSQAGHDMLKESRHPVALFPGQRTTHES